MIDQALCDHEDTEPVEVRDHATGGTRTVARICLACLAQLEAGWGCTDCDWHRYAVRRLCSLTPLIDYALVRPCKEHA